jgi:hypothetical protein
MTTLTRPTEPHPAPITLWVVIEKNPSDQLGASHVHIDRRTARAALIDAMRTWAAGVDERADRDEDDPGLLAHVNAFVADEAGHLLTDPEFTYTFCDEATAESRTFQLLAAQ